MAQCANCRIPASLQCTRCRDAPEYKLGDAISVVYCSPECQRSDWQAHKSSCATLGRRKKLFRVATMLKATLLTYRAAFYDIPLAKVEVHDDVLYLYRSPSKYGHKPFPEDVTANVAHREAALTHNQCTLARALLGPLARKLLTDVASSLENLDLYIVRPLMATNIANDNFNGGTHTVLKVRVRSNDETWIVDTAGSQYGFADALVSYDRYIAEKSGAGLVGDPTPYTASETTDIEVIQNIQSEMDLFGFSKVLGGSAGSALEREERWKFATESQTDMFAQQRKGRLHFALFVEQHVGTEKDLFDPSKDLDGSAHEFEHKLKRFTTELKTHMEGLTV
ncbi:hypothetical protein K438DRAFT_2034723 [Mycena galopus ATCC 62051]|nr:hypothetical protein K438DRAFT_2034723 [Mycena galopus ATCC 62051]